MPAQQTGARLPLGLRPGRVRDAQAIRTIGTHRPLQLEKTKPVLSNGTTHSEPTGRVAPSNSSRQLASNALIGGTPGVSGVTSGSRRQRRKPRRGHLGSVRLLRCRGAAVAAGRARLGGKRAGEGKAAGRGRLLRGPLHGRRLQAAAACLALHLRSILLRRRLFRGCRPHCVEPPGPSSAALRLRAARGPRGALRLCGSQPARSRWASRRGRRRWGRMSPGARGRTARARPEI